MESESDEDEVLYGEAPRRVSFNPNVQQSTFELEEEDDPLGKLSRLSEKQSELEYSESSSSREKKKKKKEKRNKLHRS